MRTYVASGVAVGGAVSGPSARPLRVVVLGFGVGAKVGHEVVTIAGVGIPGVGLGAVAVAVVTRFLSSLL